MIRIIIENFILFLLPTLIYVIYVAATRDAGHQGVLDDAPILWLLVAGTVLVMVTLLAFGSNTGGRPDQHYVPPSMKNGQIEPGRIE